MNDWRMTLESATCRLIFASRVRRSCLDEGLSAALAGRAELVAAELAGNAVRHCGGGEGQVSVHEKLVQIELRDQGRPLQEADFRDHFSEGQHLDPEHFSGREGRGCGLGTILRLSDAVTVIHEEQGKTLRARLSEDWPGFDHGPERLTFQ